MKRIFEKIYNKIRYRTLTILSRVSAFVYDFRTPTRIEMSEENQVLADHLDQNGFVKLDLFKEDLEDLEEQVKETF